MRAVTTIGLDIAKSVFQVHGVDAAGQVLIRRQLKRRARPGVLPEVASMSESGSRLAPRRTIGHASSKHLATRCD